MRMRSIPCPTTGTILEITPNKPWHLALRLHTAFSSPDYRFLRTYATWLQEFLIHHTLATVDIATEAGMTMQVLLMFFVGLVALPVSGDLREWRRGDEAFTKALTT